jgi:hypothetical protein
MTTRSGGIEAGPGALLQRVKVGGRRVGYPMGKVPAC